MMEKRRQAQCGKVKLKAKEETIGSMHMKTDEKGNK